jgi:hypothetical protein
MKETGFRNADEVEGFIYNCGSDVILDELQVVFHE